MKRTAPGPLTGRKLEGRYLLGDLIARGGMGVVYRGRDTRLARPVAVKVLKESLGSAPETKERFVHEAQAAAAIADPHVVSVWDQGVDESGPDPVVYLVMELVDGATLRDLIKRRSPMTVREALRVVIPLTQGLAAAHGTGLVHRDVKPENVLTSPEGSVKVTDFGLTRHVQAESATLSLVGSANYIAPELVRRQPAGKPADNYSVGIILYEMLTGVPPFRGDSPYAVSMAHVDDDMPDLRRRFPEVDAEIVEIISWCCAKEPENRPQDAAALHGELEHIQRRLTDAALDRRPPGYREDSSDLFSGLETASHTRPVQLAPFDQENSGNTSEGISATRLHPDDTDAESTDPDSSTTTHMSDPEVTSVHAQRSLDDATRVLPENSPGATRASRPAAHTEGNGTGPETSRDPRDPRIPTHVLGSAEPYRAWVWLLVFILSACMVAYLGWLVGVSILSDHSAALSLGTGIATDTLPGPGA
ncbi:protein kinase domain-containing protein [Rothia uropygialis]|uniref:protein kinase domain-containing protein n=1 Tax=Kocuria sp. 36 TaxID=1415402 RepID=UPI00101DCC6D|nr:protein kinase [Kocuria sp. 36]